MRLKTVLLPLLSAAAMFSGHANPLSLPEYEREVKLTFPDEESAKAAKLELLPLPEGKVFAFSTRWNNSIGGEKSRKNFVGNISEGVIKPEYLCLFIP